METYSFLSARKRKQILFFISSLTLFACSGGGDDGDEEPVNVLPTVNAGADLNVMEQKEVVIPALASDADGSVTSIAWVQNSGPSVSLVGGGTAALSFMAPSVDAEQILTFTISVTDNSGAQVSDTVDVTVSPNVAPTVSLGDDREVDEQVELVVESSTGDTDGTVESYLWVQTSGTAVETENTASAVLRFTAPSLTANETLTFQLTVTDDIGDQASDEINVLVIANTPPSISVGEDIQVDEQTSVVVEASASDVDGAVQSYFWTQTGGTTVTIENTASPVLRFTSPALLANETLSFQVTVTDNDLDQTTDALNVLVLANLPPSVSAGDNVVTDEQLAVNLNAVASDVDGEIDSYLWEQVSGDAVVLNNATTQAASFTAPDLSEDALLQFRVTVTDNDGDQSSDIVDVSVIVNISPVVDAGETLDVMEQVEVSLSGAASDDDGSISSIGWEQLTGTEVVLSDASSLSPTFIVPNIDEPEEITFRLTVIDNDGDEATDELTVNVQLLAYDFTLFDNYIRCDPDTPESVTFTFYDTEGVEEEFIVQYDGVEQNVQLEPSGDLPLSIKVSAFIQQFAAIDVPPEQHLKFGLTPDRADCSCDDYSITLNQEDEFATLYKRIESIGTGTVNSGTTTWENIEICEDELDVMFIHNRSAGESAQVVFEGGLFSVVEQLNPIATTIVQGDAPESTFSPDQAFFDVDLLVPRTDSQTLEFAGSFLDTDLTGMTAEYFASDIITDYRAEFYFVPGASTVTISESPAIFSGTIINANFREYHTILVSSETLAEGFDYSVLPIENIDVDIQTDKVVFDYSEDFTFDSAVIVSPGFNMLVPIENGEVDFTLLDRVGVDSLAGYIFVAPVDYAGVTGYEDSLPMFFRQHQSEGDIRFDYYHLVLF